MTWTWLFLNICLLTQLFVNIVPTKLRQFLGIDNITFYVYVEFEIYMNYSLVSWYFELIFFYLIDNIRNSKFKFLSRCWNNSGWEIDLRTIIFDNQNKSQKQKKRFYAKTESILSKIVLRQLSDGSQVQWIVIGRRQYWYFKTAHILQVS